MSLEYNISILTSQLSLGKIDRIFALNEENVPNVGALNSIEVFKKIIQLSSYNLYVSNSKNIVGFIVCMRENSDYESENFRYFKQQENKFIYIDRIAIKKDLYEENDVSGRGGGWVVPDSHLVIVSYTPVKEKGRSWDGFRIVRNNK